MSPHGHPQPQCLVFANTREPRPGQCGEGKEVTPLETQVSPRDAQGLPAPRSQPGVKNPLCSKIFLQGPFTPWGRYQRLGWRNAAVARNTIPRILQPDVTQHFSWESLKRAFPGPISRLVFLVFHFCFIFLPRETFSTLRRPHSPQLGQEQLSVWG